MKSPVHALRPVTTRAWRCKDIDLHICVLLRKPIRIFMPTGQRDNVAVNRRSTSIHDLHEPRRRVMLELPPLLFDTPAVATGGALWIGRMPGVEKEWSGQTTAVFVRIGEHFVPIGDVH